MTIKYVLMNHSIGLEINREEIETDEGLIESLQTLFLQKTPENLIAVDILTDGVGKKLSFSEALLFANVEIMLRTISDRQFKGSDLLIGQQVGIEWDAHKNDLFVYDVRKIEESRSGHVSYEYILARPHYTENMIIKTGWIERKKLIILENAVI